MPDSVWLAGFALPLALLYLCARIMGIGSRARGKAGASSQRLVRHGATSGGAGSQGSGGHGAVIAGLSARGNAVAHNQRSNAKAGGHDTAVAALKSELAQERRLTANAVSAHRSMFAEKEAILRARQTDEENERRREEDRIRDQIEEARREREDQERRLDEERAHAELRNVPGRNW